MSRLMEPMALLVRYRDGHCLRCSVAKGVLREDGGVDAPGTGPCALGAQCLPRSKLHFQSNLGQHHHNNSAAPISKERSGIDIFSVLKGLAFKAVRQAT